MADAVHEVSSGQSVTLNDIAALYYAIGRPGGGVDAGKRALVIKGIRTRTGSALDNVADTATLATNTVLLIPTIRTFPRAIHATGQLATDLMAAGYDHANKLLRRSSASVVDMLSPYTSKPYTSADVTRAYVLTQFLDLDGMDLRTAVTLHDTEGITSIAELASLSAASIQTILDGLAGSTRPEVLDDLGHAERWRASARMQTRNRASRRSRNRPFPIPFPKDRAHGRAKHYEDIAADTTETQEDRDLARRLGFLHRFQGYVIQANTSLHVRRWGPAEQAYQAARRVFHELAIDVGAVTTVDDEVGLTLDECIDTVYELLKTAPTEEEAPLAAPKIRLNFDDSRRPYKLDADNTTQDARALELPSHSSSSTTRVVLSPSFVTDYKELFLHPHLGSNANGALQRQDVIWVDSSTFAALAPYLYGGPVRQGLGRAYSGLSQPAKANSFGHTLFDLVDPDGEVLRPWSDRQEYLNDFDLGACSTDFVLPTGNFSFDIEALSTQLEDYVDPLLIQADLLYRTNRLDEASAVYADILCAIENFWEATDQSFLATDAQTAFGAVANAAKSISRGTPSPPFYALGQLSLLAAAYDDGTPVVEDYVTVTVPPADPIAFQDKVAAGKGWFSFETGVPLMGLLTGTKPNPVTSGVAAKLELIEAYIDSDLVDAFWFDYLYAQAKFRAIALGLNWYGFPASFVPAWSYEHLDATARDLLSRAVDAERQVFQLLQLYESAVEKEFLAAQALSLAVAQEGVARARVDQQVAANNVATLQAALTVEQQAAAVTKDAVRALEHFDEGEIYREFNKNGELNLVEDQPTQRYGVDALVLGAIGGLPYIGGVASALASTRHAKIDYLADLEVLEVALELADATEVANNAALAVANAEYDVAVTQAVQAKEYLNFLAAQTFNSDGYEELLQIAREIHELYWFQAHRMAWLAQQAVEYAHRRTYGIIGWEYESGAELADMMRAQRLFADLDALRGNVVASHTVRLQEVKWTIPLSRLDAAALYTLRTTGTCTFVLRQSWVDREFPGTYLHSLKHVQLGVIGIVPPGGLRGVLSMTGLSWVRVPNTGDYATGETAEDWTTTALEGTAEAYDGYVMKRLVGTPSHLCLSEFDVTRDGGVLSAPQGQLKVLEGLGLDTAWTLKLPPRANSVVFKNIRDIELTFWFLCAYDPYLEEKQDTAVAQLAADGDAMESTARLSLAINAPVHWAQLRALPPDDAADSRYFAWDLQNLPPDQDALLVRNLRAVWSRIPGSTDEITFRICNETDPVGVKVTTTDGGVLTLVQVDASGETDPPTESTVLREWLRDVFYDAVNPSDDSTWIPEVDPEQRWVIKVDPDHAGAAWQLADEDGDPVLTDTGSLVGGAGGTGVYDDGSTWTNYQVRLRIKKRGGRASVVVRANAALTNSYELQIGSDSTDNVKLRKTTSGSASTLAQRTLAYPDDEFLNVVVSVYGDATSGVTLIAEVDGIEVLSHTDSSSPHTTGTVALLSPAVGASAVEFDDLVVVRLTKLGAVRELLLEQPFSALTEDWTFVDGATAWTVSGTGHKRLDLARMLNLTFTIDYQFESASAEVPVSP